MPSRYDGLHGAAECFVFQKDFRVLSIVQEKGYRQVREHIYQSQFLHQIFFLPCFHFQGPGFQVAAEIFKRKGPAVVIALDFFATYTFKKIGLLLCFHPFRQGMDAQSFGHGDDGTHDFPAFSAALPLKSHVHLQLIKAEILQYIEG